MPALPPSQLPLPNFNTLDLATLNQQVLDALAQANQALSVFTQPSNLSSSNHLIPLESLEKSETQLQEAWGILSHLHAVQGTTELRELHQTLLPTITDFYTTLSQHQGLYDYYLQLKNSVNFAQYPIDRQASINLALRDFRLSGIALQGKDKERYAGIQARLSELSSQFSNHVLDATQRWHLELTEDDLAGLPESRQALLRQMGAQRDKKHPIATLDFPAYMAIMMYADNRALREKVYHAYMTRCVDFANDSADSLVDTELDNTPVILETLALRQELATLLGFNHYADLSLASKMAPSVETVNTFLYNLASTAKYTALADIAELKDFAKHHAIDDVAAWDVAYLSEKIQQHRFSLSQEELKPYFPAQQVVAGLFEVANRVFGIRIEAKQAPVWDKTVQFFDVYDEQTLLGGFYFDLYARNNKRSGAWMAGFRSRQVFDAQNTALNNTELQSIKQLPVAFMVCNFNPPIGDTPALLTHSEITTLFHEFGHGLHHLLTKMNVSSVAGVHGVAWDAVELPSQIMEFWVWQPEVIKLLSKHIATGEHLPAEKLQALLDARHFQSGLQMLRQLEFALFDLTIHQQNSSELNSGDAIQATMEKIRNVVSVLLPPSYSRMQNSFSHIFAGGYAAGYYSYKWAEVLAADAFSRFDNEGIFNPKVGTAFRQAVLEVGGSRDALDAFKKFRGREPAIDALLYYAGLTDATQAHTIGSTSS